MVFRSAYRITGNAADAEDVLQTVFLRLLQQESLAGLAVNPGGYFRRAAVNAALDVIRRRMKDRRMPLDQKALRVEEQEDTPEVRFGADELANWLRSVLAKLNPRAAQVFVFKCLEGCNNQEIAELLETSESTIAVTLHRTRQRLHEELETFLKRR